MDLMSIKNYPESKLSIREIEIHQFVEEDKKTYPFKLKHQYFTMLVLYK